MGAHPCGWLLSCGASSLRLRRVISWELGWQELPRGSHSFSLDELSLCEFFLRCLLWMLEIMGFKKFMIEMNDFNRDSHRWHYLSMLKFEHLKSTCEVERTKLYIRSELWEKRLKSDLPNVNFRSFNHIICLDDNKLYLPMTWVFQGVHSVVLGMTIPTPFESLKSEFKRISYGQNKLGKKKSYVVGDMDKWTTHKLTCDIN